ncbi:MAG: beta-galactosidase, partial [Deltaproteobacteria bacterium]|nr:beta-galactosidase [Deltaproteobacteria bacterium]
MNTAPLLLSAALLASLVGCASPGDAGGDGGGADACPFCNWDTTGPGDAGPGDRAAPGEDLDVGGDAPADLPGDPESADTGEDGGGPGPDGLPPEDVPEQPLTYEQYGPMTLSRKGILLNGQYVQWRFARLDYWKVPASQWERRLDLVAAAGFDGVTTAACWARHAPGTGPAEFTAGNLDLAAFLDLAAARGLRIWLLAGPWIGEGAPAGCIPPRLLASTAFSATPAQDGAVVPRESDGDFLAAAQDWLAALNAVVAPRQITVSGSAPVVFYQLEDSWDLHLFVKEADGLQMEAMEGIPVAVKQPAPGPYFAALRSAALAGGISVPILTALTGRLENGGRRVLGTGDAPGVLPAFRMDDADPREPLEARLAVLRDELRASALHGAVFSSAPGIVTGGHPGPTFLLRMLFGGADAVSVEGFDEGVPAAGMGT